MISNTLKEIKLNEEYSIKINENSKFGIAGEIWSSAYLLSSLIISEKCQKLMKNKTILEIGSGTGICGLFACLAGAKKVYLTDREDNLEILYKNFELNKSQIDEKKCNVEIKSLDWNYFPSVKNISDKIDLIIASDIIYHGMNYQKILELMRFFSQNKNINSKFSNTEILLAFTNRLSSSFEFFDIIDLEKEHWEIKKLNNENFYFDEDIIQKTQYSSLFYLKYLI
jgi:protein N-lysine methyltransferase METTL21A